MGTVGGGDIDGLPGWTTSEIYLQSTETWKTGGEGARMAQEHAISTPCTSVMCSTPESGGAVLMFLDSSSAVYLWNRLANSVWKVTSPADKASVMNALKTEPPKLTMVEVSPSVAPPGTAKENLWTQ